MDYTFADSANFNQDLLGWDISKIVFHIDYDRGASAWEKNEKLKF